MTIKRVFAIGDSCVFGQGLDVNAESVMDFTDTMRDNCWTGQICQMLGLDHTDPFVYRNDGMPGSSNDRMLRLLTNGFPQWLGRSDPATVLVLVGLSDNARTEWFYSPWSAYMPFIPNCPPSSGEDKALVKMKELHLAYFDDEREAQDRFMTQILSMQSFLKVLGVHYVLTQSIAVFLQETIRDNTFDLQKIVRRNYAPVHYNMIDWSHVFGSTHFLEANREAGFGVTPCQHPFAEGHKMWADQVYKFFVEHRQA